MHQEYSRYGLTDEEVRKSREEHGANVLTPPDKESVWKRLFCKLTGPFGHYIEGWEDGDGLIFILEIAALLSVFISCAEFFGWFGLRNDIGAGVFFEPLGILIAIMLATGISFCFELKADREFSILNKVNDETPVKVVRNGHVTKIEKKDVVVGDIVLLDTGEEIPADAELLEAVMMSVDESTLTGEPICRKSVSVNDSAEQEKGRGTDEATFPSNHVMRGTKVMEGHGVCRVFAVGDSTENGKVYRAAQIDNSVRTPLNEQLDRLGNLISKLSYGVALAVVAGRIIMFLLDGDFKMIDFVAYLLQTVMIAVTLIVVAVPEGLPMAVSLSLAYSMRRMLKTNNLVRRMHACETMGAITVICTDKTGTLTQNQMQVAEYEWFGLENEALESLAETPNTMTSGMLEVVEGMAVNSTAQLDTSDSTKVSVVGNPTEGALLLWLRKMGLDYLSLRNGVERNSEVPFTTERKYMATLVRRTDGKQMLYVKGAPEIVCGLCRRMAGNIDKEKLTKILKTYQSQAMRTLGFAIQEVKDGEIAIRDGELVADNLCMIGVVAISDPVRTDVPPAVHDCLAAGIDVKIVTGDTPGTACEIGRQIGLWGDSDGDLNIVTGQELAMMSDEELANRVMDLKIIARARPMDKKRLVEALQARNQVVAVTGDGTNDAPALKAAHVGLSMGDGTAVAKEASDITIIDNSFASIGRAVMWGRSLYRNIQRFILFQTTVNIAACLIVLAGAFMGTESPLTVTQMLWVNLIMDTFAAMALASLPPTMSVMSEKPRNRMAFIISKPMWKRIIGVGCLFFALLFVLLYVFEHSDVTRAMDVIGAKVGKRNHLSPYELSLFFTFFVMLQFWNMFNAKAFATGGSAFHFKDCQGFVFISVLILVGQVFIVTVGGQFFNVVPISVSDWVVIIVLTSLVIWFGELLRLSAG